MNYQQLNALHEKYHDAGLEIVAIPSHQFNQEYKKNEDIAKFVKKCGSKFTVTEPADVNGSNEHPLFRHLKVTSGDDRKIRWNFSTKWLVGRSGETVTRFDVRDLKGIEEHVVRLLGETGSSQL